MASRSGFNPRYALAKLGVAWAELTNSGSLSRGLADTLHRGIQAYERQLTQVFLLTGAAMHPTLGSAKHPDSVEKLLVRLIPSPSPKTVFEGDVVAFTSPFAASAVAGQQQQQAAAAASYQQDLMVRRLAALPGDELVTGEDEDAESYVIPEGHCWVLADNEELQPPHVIDSRSFGPLPLSNVLGRVLYAARSETDHGPVENSDEGMAADAPVMEMELDLQRLTAEGAGSAAGCST